MMGRLRQSGAVPEVRMERNGSDQTERPRGSELPPGTVQSGPLPLPAETGSEPERRETCSTEGAPLELNAILRGMDHYFIQQTLKRLAPQEDERKSS